jgi:hypothetical protein
MGIYLSIYLSIHPSIHPPTYLHTTFLNYLSIYSTLLFWDVTQCSFETIYERFVGICRIILQVMIVEATNPAETLLNRYHTTRRHPSKLTTASSFVATNNENYHTLGKCMFQFLPEEFSTWRNTTKQENKHICSCNKWKWTRWGRLSQV